ncbi:polysaccharide deacetylase family protein [Nonomuraea dietziae]|uniref:polysaccharide deacetylase family protein n=1 Tax=Nonomuraea dietziae TaxID=65515 RepID=UPI0031E3C660
MVRWRAVVPVVAAVMVAGLGTAPAAHARTAEKVVYLTFDDGPSEYTSKVLAILGEHGVRATFFQLGVNIKENRALTRKVFEQGHSVQNHTWSHPDVRGLSWPAFRRQVLHTDAEIRRQTGYTPQCLRPPYGAVDKRARKRAARARQAGPALDGGPARLGQARLEGDRQAGAGRRQAGRHRAAARRRRRQEADGRRPPQDHQDVEGARLLLPPPVVRLIRA